MIWWWQDGTLLMCIVIDGFIADFLWWMEDVFLNGDCLMVNVDVGECRSLIS